MKFPVDLLADVSQAELEQLAHNYMNNLLYSNPDSPEHLTLSDSTQVTINISSVGFVPLYGSGDKQKILALFSPSDPLTAVALYLRDQWWAVDNILKTADSAREGVVQVETIGERIVLYILNRVVYRAKEKSSEELPFLCHGEKDHAKIIWNNGEAVGFYSVKPTGSLCNSFSTRRYQLPVMDSIFVRKCHRGKGFGLQMLEDFVLSFKEDCLGLRYPLTKPMYKVCDKYLCQYPGDVDLLWEVESIGGPNQRTNIASKIQAMDLSAVSKSLSFTEELLGITEVTEKNVVMEAITTQIKETGSMVCTEEIVEEVTILRASKVSEAELPITARGRSSGSKRRNTGEKITEDKSEKVIRIEDIEPETPREEQVSARQETEMHDVSELVQTEGMISVGPEENGEDVVDNAPKEEAATMSDKPATVLASQDLEEADVTSAPTTKETQVDGAQQNLNNSPHDPQITVENVSSEIEEAEEECQKEGTAVLVVLEEVLEVHKEADTQNKVGEGNQIEVTDEKSEERVTQHELSLSTHATSEGGEAGKTGRSVVKAIKIAQSETPRRRSERHRKPEEGETTSLDGERVLRRRTVATTPTSKRKYTQRSQKVYEELEKEDEEVAEEDEDSTNEEVEDLAVTVGEEPEEITSIKDDVVEVEHLREDKKQQLEDEQLTNTEETVKEEEPGVEETTLKGSSTELPDTAETALTKENGDEKVTDESEKEQKDDEVETSMIEDKQEVSDDEIEEPPVVHKRALRGRRKVTPTPQPTKQSKSHQKQEEHTADEKTTDKEMVEQEETVDKAEKDVSTEEEGTTPEAEEAAEDDIPSTEVIMGVRKEIQEDKDAEGETDTALVMEADKEEEADDMIKEPDTVAAASETVTEESEEKHTGSEILKLQNATVILVDLKTTCHHLSVKEAEQTAVDGEYAAPEKEEMELMAAEEEEVADGAAETETVENEELKEDNSDKEREESANVDGEKSGTEEAPCITRVFRSGRKTVKANYGQQEEHNIGEVINEKKVDEAEKAVEVEGDMEVEVMAKEAVAVTVPVEEKQSAVLDICADIDADIPVVDDAEENLSPAEEHEAMSLEEEEAIVETRALRSGTKTITATPRHKTRSRKQANEDSENSEEEEPAVTTRTLRQGRISASATPKDKSRRTCKQVQEEEQKGVEESESVKQTGEEAVKEAAASIREENLGPEIDVEEGNAVAEEGQHVLEEQSESISKTFGEREVEASGEECDERMPSMGDEEVEPPPVAVTRSLRSGGKTPKAAPKSKSRRSKKRQDEEKEEKEEGGASPDMSADGEPTEPRNLRRGRKSVCRRLLQKEEEGAKESAEEAEVEEEEEAGLGSAEPPTEEEEKAPEEDKNEVEKEELVAVEVENGVSKDGTMTITEEEENTAGVTVAADDLVQGETDTALPNPATDSAILAPNEEEAPASAEEQQSEETAPQLSDLQRVTVVLVDLKKTHLIQEEASAVEEGVPVEKSAAEVEDEQREETAKEEESMAEEHIPGSPAGTEETELEKVPVEKDGFGEKPEDADTIQDTGDTGEADGTAKEDEAKSADDEEEEPTVTETRTRRSRKQTAKATPRCKLARGRQKKGEEENKETSEIGEEEPAVQVRVLRGRKSIPTKRTDEQPQEEDEEGGEESTAAEEREAEEEEEQAEEQQQMIDQEKEERIDAKDATQQAENVEPEAPVGQNADEETALDDVAEEEEAPVIETRHLRSGEKTVRATARSKTTKREEQEEEATGEESSEGDISAVETRVLRKGRRSAAATPRRKSKRARKQCEAEEDEEKETIQAEEIIVGGTKADENEDNSDEKKEDKDGEETVAQREENTEPEAEIKNIEAVAEEPLTEQEAVEEEVSALSETSANGLEETPVGESAEEAPNTDEGKVADEEEAPVVETRVLRSGGSSKTIKATPRSKTTKSQQKENEQEERVVGKSAGTDESAVETRVLRKGRRSAPATPLYKSKRARIQCQPEEEEEEESCPAEEEEEEAGQELPEEKGEMAEEEGKSVEIGVKKDKDVEEEEVDGVAGGESAVGDADQMKDTSTEEATVFEAVAVDETDTDMVKVEETNSAEEEETTEVGSHTTEEALVADKSMVTEEEAPAVTTRTLRSKTKTLHATPSRRSRRQKDQGVVETQQQQEENPEDEEVHQLVDDSHENRELNAKEEAEADETSPTGQEAGPPAEDNAEDQAKEMADLINNRVVEPSGEEPATGEMESPEKEPSESKEDTTVDSSTVEGRSLRGRMKTVDNKKDKAKRRSIRKRPRVDYRENEEEDERGETEEEEDKVESVEDQDNEKDEYSTNEAEQEESRKEEELENNMGAVESTGEKGDVINLALDTDEEVETAGSSQEDEEDEQNMSEEEVEPIVIGKRVLRGRSIPSLIITPQSKSRRRSAKGQKSEESLSDEEKSPQTAQGRSLRKRKRTEVTPTRKSKRHSRV